MVLGLSTKNRKSSSVQMNYLIHIQEIKPWPPSQSLRSLRSVVIQWEHGGRNSGSTNNVVPSVGSIVGEGKIEFNESFRLPVTLLREMPVKGKDKDAFHKNCLELNLCVPRRDKTQLLATAVIDLADYGVLKETISINAPMNSKRSFRNTSEPVLYIKIQPINKGCASSSSRDGLSKGVSLDPGGESVSALMNEEYPEEAEVASFTDDDFSSHSSLTNGGSPQNEENGPDGLTGNKGELNRKLEGAQKLVIDNHIEPQENLKGSSSCSSSIDLSSDVGSPVNGHASVLNAPDSSSMSVLKNDVSQSVHSYESKKEEVSDGIRSNSNQCLVQVVHEKSTSSTMTIRGGAHGNSEENTSNSFAAKAASSLISPQTAENLGSKNSGDFQVKEDDNANAWRASKDSFEDAAMDNDNYDSYGDVIGKEHQDNEQNSQNLEEDKYSSENERTDAFSQDTIRNEGSLGIDAVSLSDSAVMKENTLKLDRLKHVKSVRSSSDSIRSNGLVSRNQHNELKEVGSLEDSQNSVGNLGVNGRKNAKVYPKDTRTTLLDSKIQQLEHKIKMLEGELREAAAIEASLYSVVAEHGSSASKVHAPARRLSRLYLHTCREKSQSRRASAARSAVSGLVLVAKACGNDVPRLTFWLSNSVVLRAIISQSIGASELSVSAQMLIEKNGGRKGNKMLSSSLKWKELSPSRKENKNVVYRGFGEWDDPHTFISALERVEAWIFSRTVESIWWQTLTPHMQSAATQAIDGIVASGSKKSLGRTSSSGDQDQGNFSLDLWKKAFKDACERLCPVRAGGHECGCLPLLARLIMEQCVARLDVAMFNAILRESADDIPTDPVSDPISDSKVLPIPAGKSSFGAGAQLKTAIGNWSRWLTDLFGMDDDDSLEDDNEKDEREDASFKSFHLLNALSDLMMLPKDMLLSRSIRKEVCPKFGAPLIKSVLDNFHTDEFSPDPIPDVVFEALEFEDNTLEDGEETVTAIPCIADPPIYLPHTAALVASNIGELGNQSQLRRSGSSMLRKSYTSDDELDELNSPLASILLDGSWSSPPPTKPNWKSKEMGNQNATRYELLREIWMNSE